MTDVNDMYDPVYVTNNSHVDVQYTFPVCGLVESSHSDVVNNCHLSINDNCDQPIVLGNTKMRFDNNFRHDCVYPGFDLSIPAHELGAIVGMTP